MPAFARLRPIQPATPTAASDRRRRRISSAITAAVIGLVITTAAPVAAVPDVGSFGAEVDDYASYDGQTECLDVEQPGVRAFRDLVLAAYPNTGRGNILRDCHVGGRSEHKEGRAWDWVVNVNVPAERQAAEELLEWLLATDEHGNDHAMARRFGIMYIIWDHRVWNAYRPDEGWRPYTGASPHTDHMHFSFSWDGALGHTSYYTDLEVQPFSDVPRGSMYADPVAWLSQTGITHGTGNGDFEPGRSVTRQQMASFLWRLMGEEDAPAANFDDVASGNGHRQAIDWLAAEGITLGDEDGNFNPSQRVTRAQMASFLWRTVRSPQSTNGHPFHDVPAAHTDAVSWLAELEITTGVADQTFDGAADVTRGQMALFLYRLTGNAQAWTDADPISPNVRF